MRCFPLLKAKDFTLIPKVFNKLILMFLIFMKRFHQFPFIVCYFLLLNKKSFPLIRFAIQDTIALMQFPFYHTINFRKKKKRSKLKFLRMNDLLHQFEKSRMNDLLHQFEKSRKKIRWKWGILTWTFKII